MHTFQTCGGNSEISSQKAKFQGVFVRNWICFSAGQKLLNHFEVRPVCDVASSLLTVSHYRFFPLLCANNSRDKARQADRQWEGKCFSLDNGECRSPVLNRRLSLSEDGWCAVGGIKSEKYNYISGAAHLTIKWTTLISNIAVNYIWL